MIEKRIVHKKDRQEKQQQAKEQLQEEVELNTSEDEGSRQVRASLVENTEGRIAEGQPLWKWLEEAEVEPEKRTGKTAEEDIPLKRTVLGRQSREDYRGRLRKTTEEDSRGRQFLRRQSWEYSPGKTDY